MKMIYKSFKFPYNPKTTGFKCDRAYIKHKYPGLVGNELEDYGRQTVSIEGGHQYVFKLNCANLQLEISQGQLKSAIDYLGEYNMYYNARTKIRPCYYHHNGKLNLAKLDF